jgi:hypothetical protein
MRRILAVAALILVSGAGTACRGSSGTGVASAGGGTTSAHPSTKSDTAAFRACMHEHGQNLPEPGPNGPNAFPEATASSAAFEAALAACQHLWPDGGPQPPDAQQFEQLRAYAVCMRAHGIEITDPLADGNMRIGGRLENVSRDQLEADPTFQAAQAACKDKLPGTDAKGGK